MKNKVRSSIVAGISALLFLFPNLKDSELKDIAKTHLGVYECKRATLGKEDFLNDFVDIRLELTDAENFLLLYQKKSGEKKKIQGKYNYDREKKILTMEDKSGGFKREFPLVDGKLLVSLPLGKKLLVLHFEQK